MKQPNIVEQEVNEWIKEEKPNIIQISTTGDYSHISNYVLTVLYNDTQSISLNS